MQKISSIPVATGKSNSDSDFGPSVAVMDAAEIEATLLLNQLAHLFPVVSIKMQSEEYVKSWIECWSVQIASAGLQSHELGRGMLSLQNLPPNHTPSWPAFYALCRPKMTDEEVRETYCNAVHWVSAKVENICHMPDDLWAAGVHFGLEALRLSHPDQTTLSRWRECLEKVRRNVDPAILARRPKSPSAGLLPPPEGQGDNERLNSARRAALERLRRLVPRFDSFAAN